jgi:uncharacterized protein YbjT (DUF2867 family)
MIVVSGASGRVGGAIARQLAEAGIGFRAAAPRPPAATVVVADFRDPVSLDRAFAGAERLYLASWQPGREEIRLQANAIAAARRQAVRHVVLLSGAGADRESPLAVSRWHGEKERQLEESGLAFTHLRPTWFMQNLFGFLDGGRIRLPAGEGRAGFVDVADIAAVAVRALTEHGHDGTAYRLTRPELLGYAEVAAVLSEALGRAVRYEDVAPERYRAQLLAAGWDAAAADSYLGLFERFRAEGEARLSDAVERVTGRRPTRLAEFARRNAGAFERG